MQSTKEIYKERALVWYKRSAEQGNVESIIRIGDYYYYGLLCWLPRVALMKMFGFECLSQTSSANLACGQLLCFSAERSCHLCVVCALCAYVECCLISAMCGVCSHVSGKVPCGL